MDTSLARRLNNLGAQNEKLHQVRNKYLLKDAERKTFEARLVNQSIGKSHAEKVVKAQASDEWLEFHKELAALNCAYEFEKLKYDILDKAYLAEHLTLKLDAETISRQGSVA